MFCGGEGGKEGGKILEGERNTKKRQRVPLKKEEGRYRSEKENA